MSDQPISDGPPWPCRSCQGTGEIGTDNGPMSCPDCFGQGRQLDSLERTEWRLRDIERAHQGTAPGGDADVRWLVFELRRSREVLLQILSRCQEDDGAGERRGEGPSGHGDGVAAEIRFLANRALGLYPIAAD
jgi:hypothetical protein